MGLIYLCTNIRSKHNIILSFPLCLCIIYNYIYTHTFVHKYTLHTHITRITDITNITDIDITDLTDIIYVYICMYIYIWYLLYISVYPLLFSPRTLSSALGGEVSNLTSKALGSKIGAPEGVFFVTESIGHLRMIFGNLRWWFLVVIFCMIYPKKMNTCCLFSCLMTYIYIIPLFKTGMKCHDDRNM